MELEEITDFPKLVSEKRDDLLDKLIRLLESDKLGSDLDSAVYFDVLIYLYEKHGSLFNFKLKCDQLDKYELEVEKIAQTNTARLQDYLSTIVNFELRLADLNLPASPDIGEYGVHLGYSLFDHRHRLSEFLSDRRRRFYNLISYKLFRSRSLEHRFIYMSSNFLKGELDQLLQKLVLSIIDSISDSSTKTPKEGDVKSKGLKSPKDPVKVLEDSSIDFIDQLCISLLSNIVTYIVIT